MPVSFARLLRSLLLPLTMTILVPAAVLGAIPVTPSLSPLVLAGLVIILAGLLILVMTIKAFLTVGQGTLAPWDPPRRLVVSGMYRYVRNPMISGVLMIILGEAMALQSVPLFYWFLVFLAFNTSYFIFSEEPKLAKKFGQDYEEYKANVPRWLPRLTPWRPRE